MSMQPQLENFPWLEERSTQNSLVYARLKPYVTPTQAEANLKRMVADLGANIPVSMRACHCGWLSPA
jgi:hypothetical protein